MGKGIGLLVHHVGKRGSSVNRKLTSLNLGVASQNLSRKHRLARTTGPISRESSALCFCLSSGVKRMLPVFNTPSGTLTIIFGARNSAPDELLTRTSFFCHSISVTWVFSRSSHAFQSILSE